MHVNYSKNVFINCPFDKDYKPLLKALVYTVLYFGYEPRLSLEQSDSGSVRLQKILDCIQESQYGIHDLSRIQATEKNEFFRFNMPFELGADFGCKTYNSKHNDKAFLVLAKEEYEYMKAISDLNGIDIKHHNNEAEDLIYSIRAWFIETVGLRKLDGPMKIWFKYNDFQTQIFEEKFKNYYGEYDENTAEKIAVDEINKMPMPEFIDEIKSFLKK